MLTITEFDATKYRLGSLCKRGHDWNKTGQSLRYIQCGTCLKCNSLRGCLRARSRALRPGLYSLTVEQRFWSYVDKNDPSGCWIWKNKLDKNGYGSFQVKINNEWERWRAHRFSWYLVNGQIPNNLLVCHSCDCPSCINPSHLFLGTPKDNSEDMVRKGRAPIGNRSGSVKHPETVARGEKNGSAKLNAANVLQIRELYENGNMSMSKLAKAYGIGLSQVCRIIHRETWKHI